MKDDNFRRLEIFVMRIEISRDVSSSMKHLLRPTLKQGLWDTAQCGNVSVGQWSNELIYKNIADN